MKINKSEKKWIGNRATDYVNINYILAIFFANF